MQFSSLKLYPSLNRQDWHTHSLQGQILYLQKNSGYFSDIQSKLSVLCLIVIIYPCNLETHWLAADEWTLKWLFVVLLPIAAIIRSIDLHHLPIILWLVRLEIVFCGGSEFLLWPMLFFSFGLPTVDFLLVFRSFGFLILSDIKIQLLPRLVWLVPLSVDFSIVAMLPCVIIRTRLALELANLVASLFHIGRAVVTSHLLVYCSHKYHHKYFRWM